jgi:hypothetical protein
VTYLPEGGDILLFIHAKHWMKRCVTSSLRTCVLCIWWCLNVLVFCSCSFERQQDEATPSHLIYVADGGHRVPLGSGTPFTHNLAETLQGGVMRSVEPAENIRTWTRCSAEPPKPPWKLWLLHYILFEPPDPYALFMSIHMYLSSIDAVGAPFEDDRCVHCVWKFGLYCFGEHGLRLL